MHLAKYQVILRVLVLSHFSHIQLFVTLWTVAHQAPLSRGFPGKNTGVGCHFLLQGIFLTQGSNPCLFITPALAGGFFITSTRKRVRNLLPYEQALLAVHPCPLFFQHLSLTESQNGSCMGDTLLSPSSESLWTETLGQMHSLVPTPNFTH